MDNFEENYMIARATIEHHLIPDFLFDNPKQIIGALAADGEKVLFSIYNEMIPERYKLEDFKVKAVPNKYGGLSVVARLPNPDGPLACTVIGLLCGKDGADPQYYTVETTIDGDFLLCTKPDKNSHAILAEKCGNTLKEHVSAILKHMNIGLPEEKK